MGKLNNLKSETTKKPLNPRLTERRHRTVWFGSGALLSLSSKSITFVFSAGAGGEAAVQAQGRSRW